MKGGERGVEGWEDSTVMTLATGVVYRQDAHVPCSRQVLLKMESSRRAPPGPPLTATADPRVPVSNTRIAWRDARRTVIERSVACSASVPKRWEMSTSVNY